MGRKKSLKILIRTKKLRRQIKEGAKRATLALFAERGNEAKVLENLMKL